MPSAVAEVVATGCFDVARQYSLADALQSMTSEQSQVTALCLSNLLQKPPKRIHLSERFDLLQRKPVYTPAAAVASPEVPHFVKVAVANSGSAEHRPPALQAPFICQVCGGGFVTRAALWKHTVAQHHSWSEYRRRLMFEVQPCQTVRLQPIEKRSLAGHLYQDMMYSRPARDTLRPGHITMRQVVACATCAIKDWIDDCLPLLRMEGCTARRHHRCCRARRTGRPS